MGSWIMGLVNWCRLCKRRKKTKQCVIKDWQLSQKKCWNFQRNTTPSLSLLPSPLHTPTHNVFASSGDNNGSWRSRDRRLQTLTALCYVMNVWLPSHLLLPTLHQYGATDFGFDIPCALYAQSYIKNESKHTRCFSSYMCSLLYAKEWDI